MRTRKQELGDMNIIGAKVEKQRKAIGMKWRPDFPGAPREAH